MNALEKTALLQEYLMKITAITNTTSKTEIQKLIACPSNSEIQSVTKSPCVRGIIYHF